MVETSTKERILLAGKDVIFERGYHGATISEIMKRAKLGYGTFYLYFKTKEDLFLELIRMTGRKLEEELEEAIELAKVGKFEEAKEKFFIEAFKSFMEHKKLMKALFYEAMCMDERFRQIHREKLNYMLEKTYEILKILGYENAKSLKFILFGTAKLLMDLYILENLNPLEVWREVLRELKIL